MSKTRIVEIIEDSGSQYGQISHPDDLMKSQQFATQHIEQITVDYLNAINQFEVAGCAYTLFGQREIEIAIGRIYQYGGRQHEVDPADVSIPQSDSEFDRIDLIVVTLSDNVDSLEEFVPFHRLRTSQELIAGTLPYPPTQFQRSREKKNLGVVGIKIGIPAENPVAPNPNPNEVPLFEVSVEANSEATTAANITDRRVKCPNLAVLNSIYSNLNGDVAILKNQIIQALAYENLVRDFTSVTGQQQTLVSILQDIYAKLLVLKYRYPAILSSDSRCPASVGQENNNWVVDIPVGIFVEFGDGFVSINPDKFDPAIGARYANSSNADFGYDFLFENESNDNFSSNNNVGGNVVRFNAPANPKALFLKRDGSLVFRDTPTPSNSNECLLMKITPKSNAAPILKRYKNLRSGIVEYSNTYNSNDASTARFQLDVALPPGVGYIKTFGIKADTKVHYELLPLSITAEDFDGQVTVPGIQNGDKWVVTFTFLSNL